MPLPTNQRELDREVGHFVAAKLWNVKPKVKAKITQIQQYLNNAEIENVVIGVSGGLDSAVVLALLVHALSPFMKLKIHAFTIDFDLYDGVFDDKYVKELERFFGDNVSFKKINATDGFNMMLLDLGLQDATKHIKAQSSYALRYQMLFTYAQVLNAVTVGTTNRDEFEYAGWFGKNSDMVVDLQVITDWNKCQVIEAAKLLGVPQSIIVRAPTGDLLDLSTDEENFGCTYNELAYFQERVLSFAIHPPFLMEKFAKLRALHEKNKHKYQGQTFNPVFIR